MSAAAATVVGFDPTRDKSYRATGLGRDIADFLAWAESAGMSPRTLDQYERDLAKGALMFPHRDRDTLERGDAIQIAAAYKTKERRVRVAAWRSFYRFLSVVYDVPADPFRAVPQIRKPKQAVPDVFTDAEIETLCGLGGIDGPLMEIMFGTGARKGDCRHLQLKHFRPSEDPDERDKIAFLDGKGGKDRLVPVQKRVATAIAKLSVLEGLGDNDYFWYSVRANETHRKVMRQTPVGEGTFARWWGHPETGCLTRAGVRYRNPHVTRHTFATNWLRKGGRLETLSLVMGHASISTTLDLYGHLDMSDVSVDMAIIEGRM